MLKVVAVSYKYIGYNKDLLQEARADFRQLLCDSSVRINALAKKLGSCVEKARPYYEARIKAKEVSCLH